MDNDSILSLCKNIRTIPGYSSDELNAFREKYPKLYTYVSTEQNYDENMLINLLNYKQNMETNYLDTNMTVAELIADKYLYNNTLKRPDENEMEYWLNKIRKVNKKR